VGKSSLGRVLDPGALDAATGPRARLSVEVPAAWLAEGADLAVTAPARLPCGRCDGGGCDTCGRSGALRAPEVAGDRVVHARVPRAAGAPHGVALRILHPFGEEHAIEQLLLELRAGAAPSAGVTRVAPGSRGDDALAVPPRLPWPLLALALVAAVVLALFGR
jgi:hypothetical protein